MAEFNLCVWQVSDGSYRVRLTADDRWSDVKKHLLSQDPYWCEVVTGLRPVFVLPTVGRERSISLCRSVMRSLGIENRMVKEGSNQTSFILHPATG